MQSEFTIKIRGVISECVGFVIMNIRTGLKYFINIHSNYTCAALQCRVRVRVTQCNYVTSMLADMKQYAKLSWLTVASQEIF